MWDIKLKATNEQTRQTNTDSSMAVTRVGEEAVRQQRVNGIKHMVTEGSVTLGGKLTMQYTNDVSQNRTLETFIILLTNIPQ